MSRPQPFTSPPFSVNGLGSTRRWPVQLNPFPSWVLAGRRTHEVPSHLSARTNDGLMPSLGFVASTPATTGPALVAVTVRSARAGRLRSGGSNDHRNVVTSYTATLRPAVT